MVSSSSSGDDSGSEQWSGQVGAKRHRRLRHHRRHLRRHYSPAKQTEHAESNWPFWWLGSAVIAVLVTSSFTTHTESSVPVWRPTNFADLRCDRGFLEHAPDMLCQPNYDDEHFFDAFKKRPKNMGVRYRDDEELHRIASAHRYQQQQQQAAFAYPVLVQERPRTDMPGGSNGPSSTGDAGRTEPTLEDIDLIDVLWRADIDNEKGGVPTASATPQEQYERDLQLLTEKSIQAPLTREESSRFEDLSKVYFEDFYTNRRGTFDFGEKTFGRGSAVASSSSSCTSPFHSATSSSAACSSPSSSRAPTPVGESTKRDVATPTDADLDALFEDMGKESSDLNTLMMMGGGVMPTPQSTPLLNNVSLTSVVPFNPANVTELDYSALAVAQISAAPMTSLPNDTLGYPAPTQYWFNAATDPTTGNYQIRQPVLNMSTLVLPPPMAEDPALRPPAHHELTQLTGRMPRAPVYTHEGRVERNSVRVSVSNETTSICSSSSSSSPSSTSSPHYASSASAGSDGENLAPRSRFFGKLAPLAVTAPAAAAPFYDDDEEDDDEGNVEGFFGASGAPSTGGNGLSATPRRRGRQSKDEQLASDSGLPVTAAIIADMSLPELQKMLKSESLTEVQKQLIRKIRRRGKNKVAARTCRQRRGQARTVHNAMHQMAYDNSHILGYH